MEEKDNLDTVKFVSRYGLDTIKYYLMFITSSRLKIFHKLNTSTLPGLLHK